nr:immunoglobulin light chain junction region [Macaca mulatta]
CMQVFQTPYSF